MSVLELISQLRKEKIYPKLDNGKLKLVGNANGISAELLKTVKENKDLLMDFLMESNAVSADAIPIENVKTADHYPLSNAQKRLWVLSQFEGGNSAYVISTPLYLKGEVIVEHLEEAFRMAIQRHESLRTGFEVVEDAPVQIIHDRIDFNIEYVDFSNRTDIKQVLKEEDRKADNHVFDLTNPPLIYVKIIKISEDEYAMISIVHHIVSDGWTVGILLQEVMANYKNNCLLVKAKEPSLTIQYKDFSAWLTNKLKGDFGDRARNYWNRKKMEELDPLDLPYDFPRPPMNDFEGAKIKNYFEPEFYSNIELLARKNQTTVFNVFRAGLSLAFHKWSNQKELIIGTPVAGRSHHELANQMGLYVNTLPLKSSYSSETTFAAYLKEVSIDSLETFKFQDYPLDLILDENPVDRDTSRSPLFDVLMVVQNTAIGDGTVQITEQHGFNMYLLDHYMYGSGDIEKTGVRSKFDLTFNFSKDPNGKYFLETEFRTSLFKSSTVQKIFKMFTHILNQAIESPETQLKHFSIIDKKEIDKILNTFNAPINTHSEQSVVELFAETFEKKKNEPAIICEDQKVTFNELHLKSNAVSKILIDEDVKRVAFFIERSEKVLSVVLGALKSNVTYVPIDVNYPDERIRYILNDAQVELVLTDNTNASRINELFEGRIVQTDDLADEQEPFQTKENDKDNVAYLIYTSGSTGNPKGVEITHRNVIAFLKWCDQEFKSTAYEMMYAVTSYCFDLSIFEMLLPLVQGKKIRVLKSAIEISDCLANDKNVLINTVPSVVRGLIDQVIDWSNVAALNLAGEPVPKYFKEALDYTSFEVRNLYGPSEDTTYSTCYKFANDGLSYIPIGVPVGDTQAYILDDDRNVLPVGVDGEIYLSGESIAKGYFNRAELTAEKFTANPFLPNRTMYRTGDIGRWNKEGKILFVGRIDDQVKVRGYRIELGEIQYKLEQLDQVNEAVVVVTDFNNDKEIVAYFTSETSVSPSQLTKGLSSELPAYMIPGLFLQIDEIPLNSNGKVDKKKLPKPSNQVVTEITPPSNELENKLFDIWKETLSREDFGVRNNFFELGGHSLKATKLRSMIQDRIEKEISMNELFVHPTIEQQAVLLEGKAKKIEQKIIKIDTTDQDLYQLSFAQERLWVLTKFDEASKAYHMPAAFEVTGRKLDLDRLNTAMQKVIGKHESLRTVFVEVDNQPYQKILPAEAVQFEIQTLTLSSEDQLKEQLQKDWNKAFNLADGPLLRCQVINVNARQFLSFNMHHIISDGWSVGVLFQDVVKAYGERDLGQLDIQYKDFSLWQKEMLAPEVMNQQLRYWRELFGEGVTVLELPYDKLRPEIKTYSGDRIQYSFGRDVLKSIKSKAAALGATPFMHALANVSILLKKLSNQNSFAVGTPVSGRDSIQLQKQIGFYVNTLPLNVNLDGNETYLSLLSRTKNEVLSAFEFQNFPFELLVEELQPKRDMSRSPLFDVMVAYQNFEVLESSHLKIEENLGFKRMEFGSNVTKYDLLFSFTEENEHLMLELEYNTDLFEKDTVISFVNRLETIFKTTANDQDIAIKEVSTISKDEEQLILKKADRTHVGYNTNETIVSLFKKAVADHPENVALKVDDKTFTYKELDALSGKLAFKLKQEYAINNEDFVVLHNSRSEWMLISILAVLKAGGVYVPVDPEYPTSRINYILNDSQAKLVLFDQPLSNEIDAKDCTRFDVSNWDYEGEELDATISPDQLAYVIYTSGTTGNPKGVLIEHRNVTRLLFTEESEFDFNANDKWSLFHSYCFDFSVWEMYGALLNGATLVMVPKHIAQESQSFYTFLSEEKITILNQTPTAFRSLSLSNQDRFDKVGNDLRYIIFGGEALMPAVLEKWYSNFPSTNLVNMYGITETTVHVTYKHITATEILENKSNIGKPIATLSCYVLDVDFKPAPIGVVGELCVGGAGVARGYHNRPELTTEKFVDDPFNAGQKIYRSGDFARVLPSGDLEYLGRKDDQVKIRGHRIELHEVEDGVKKLDAIKDAIVLTLKNSAEEHELVAYIILEQSADGNPSIFRNELIGKLPGYMIPSHFVVLDDFPKTANGKFDKSALPELGGSVERAVEYVAPRNDIDEKIVTIWKEILDIDEIGIKDNFFDLGGHSLKATRVISKIQEEFGVKIDLKNLFIDPTIEHLSGFVETLQWMNDSSNEKVGSGEDELIL